MNIKKSDIAKQYVVLVISCSFVIFIIIIVIIL